MPADQLFDLSAAGEGTGFQFVGIARAIKIAATYRATEPQRAAALRAVEMIAAQPPASPPPRPAPPAKKKPATPPPITPSPSRPVADAPPEAQPDPSPSQKPLPKLVSVEVPKAPNQPEANKGAHDIVIVNTSTRQLVGNTVYVTDDLPNRNETVKIKSLTVQHLGTSF
ncbi:hypothetical protein BH23VER1_BH23VER1_28020 [soil metagenome]